MAIHKTQSQLSSRPVFRFLDFYKDESRALEERFKVMWFRSLSYADLAARTAETGPVSRYRDPVLPSLLRWSAERIKMLVKSLETACTSVNLGNWTQAEKSLRRTRHLAIDSLATLATFRQAQSRQRSGFRKDQRVIEIYETIQSLFDAYARLEEFGYLCEYVCTGVEPHEVFMQACEASGKCGESHVH